MFCRSYRKVCSDSEGNNYIWLDLIAENKEEFENTTDITNILGVPYFDNFVVAPGSYLFATEDKSKYIYVENSGFEELTNTIDYGGVEA